MEEFVKNQIKYGLKYLPSNLAKSYFIPKKSDESKAMRKRGFIRGVCHPNENYEQIKDANIGWIRIDIPFPFEKNGDISESYNSFKARAKGYVDHGIKVMAVTPYPIDYIECGMDPRTEDGKEKVIKVAEFMINDLKGYVGALQLTNEMGLPRFTLPLTLEEASEFIGMQLKAMYPLRGDIMIGYNSAGPEAMLHALMRDYSDYLDYVGIDIYLGCFDGLPGLIWAFEALLRYLWALTKKPIIVQEFGYISGGAPKSREQKLEILNSYGVNSEEETKDIIEEFVERLPKDFKEHLKHDAKDDPSRYYDLLFNSDFRQHFYKEMSPMTKIPGFDHTPEGQAKFYDVLLNKLYKLPFVSGAIIYCYSDSKKCYVCGQSDCPVETRWGLVTNDGEPKPSYYAVKRQFGRIKFFDNVAKGSDV